VLPSTIQNEPQVTFDHQTHPCLSIYLHTLFTTRHAYLHFSFGGIITLICRKGCRRVTGSHQLLIERSRFSNRTLQTKRLICRSTFSILLKDTRLRAGFCSVILDFSTTSSCLVVFRDDLNPCCFSRIEESSEPRSSHRPHGTRESLFVGPTRPTLTRARCCQGWRLHSNPIPPLWRLDTQTKSSIRDVVLIDDEALVSSMRKRSDGGGLQVKVDRSLSSHCASSSLFTGIGMWTN
jgi:hypothetical protein